MEAMEKTAKDLEDTARLYYNKILYWHVNKFRGSSQSGLVPVKDRNRATISIRKESKRDE